MTLPDAVKEATLDDKAALEAFLKRNNLSSFELLVPGSIYWLVRDKTSGEIIASAGLECEPGEAVLLRSVAVLSEQRKSGWGKLLSERALRTARSRGYKTAYLFSSSTGGYWQRFGFEEIGTDELVAALPTSPQVRRFIESGKILRERAWRKSLAVEL